jgi:hypothetical protein
MMIDQAGDIIIEVQQNKISLEGPLSSTKGPGRFRFSGRSSLNVAVATVIVRIRRVWTSASQLRLEVRCVH